MYTLYQKYVFVSRTLCSHNVDLHLSPKFFFSILIAPVRKNKKWKHFVQLYHGKPVSDQQKRNNEMVLIMVIIHNLMSIRLSSVGFAKDRPGIYTLPSGGFLEGF